MKIEIIREIKHSRETVTFYADGVETDAYALSKLLTQASPSHGLGVFATGAIEYYRADGAKKVFQQPLQLHECRAEVLIERITSVRHWVDENDRTQEIMFEVDDEPEDNTS